MTSKETVDSVTGQTKTELFAPPSSKADSRFAIIVGLGAGTIINTMYLDPVVNKINNNVIIEKSERMRYTASIGFSWTPYIYKITRYDRNGAYVEYAPRGFTVAVFANPASLSASSGINSTFDWGAGLGWRWSGVSLLATVDFFTVKQPRKYFLDQFSKNDSQYIVDGETQKDIALTDNTLFKNKGIAALGLKLVIPLDLFDNFKKGTAAE